MKLSLSSSTPKADILFLLFFKGQKLSKNETSLLDNATLKMVEARFSAKDFEGEEGQILTLFTSGGNFKRVILAGRGDKNKQLPKATEQLGAQLVAVAKKAKASRVAVQVNPESLSELSYGMVLGAYEFMNYKKADPKTKELEELIFVSEVNKTTKDAVERASVFMRASALTRGLINTCAGDLNTQNLVDEAKKVAQKSKLKITIFDEAKLKKIGCGALVGVGKGASVGSRMVILEYRSKTTAKEPQIAFIGKGIVFDSGGMNLKPTGYIETMKEDMAGASTVLGTMQAIAELKLPGYFLGVMAIAENAISDRAQHPGDVVRAYNGKTIEITNTDAEGRLVLADAVAYTEKNYKPKRMIDIATLTGAVTVALGYNITGVMGNDQKWIDDVMDAGKATYERYWQLPMDEDFQKGTKGEFTDLKNDAKGLRAGTIMGAAFIKEFVEKTPWVHLDIGGTGWAEKPDALTHYGATGVGLRTFIELAVRHGK
jgi:leucyl aminopeptidase